MNAATIVHVGLRRSGCRPCKSLSHNMLNAGSDWGFVVRAPHWPRDAAAWRGGDGGGNGPATGADDLADSGRLVAHRAARPAARGITALAWATRDCARRILDAVLYVLRTGCQWKAAPREFGFGDRRCIGDSSAGSNTACGRRCGGSSSRTMTPPRAWSGPGSPPTPPCTKRRWAGKKTGPNLTDRAKSGTKRHVLTDGGGAPIALVITAANTPDKTALAELLDARVVRPPAFTAQHLCLDKGYDYADIDETVSRRRFVAHIRRRGEARRRCRRGERARRWVVERTHSWFNRHCKLLIRWEKKPQNYLALVQFAAALIVWRLVIQRWISSRHGVQHRCTSQSKCHRATACWIARATAFAGCGARRDAACRDPTHIKRPDSSPEFRRVHLDSTGEKPEGWTMTTDSDWPGEIYARIQRTIDRYPNRDLSAVTARVIEDLRREPDPLSVLAPLVRHAVTAEYYARHVGMPAQLRPKSLSEIIRSSRSGGALPASWPRSWTSWPSKKCAFRMTPRTPRVMRRRGSRWRSTGGSTKSPSRSWSPPGRRRSRSWPRRDSDVCRRRFPPPTRRRSRTCVRNARGAAGRRLIRVHFDRDCADAHGDHFHRVCPCGHRWVKRAAEDNRARRVECARHDHGPRSAGVSARGAELGCWPRPSRRHRVRSGLPLGHLGSVGCGLYLP